MALKKKKKTKAAAKKRVKKIIKKRVKKIIKKKIKKTIKKVSKKKPALNKKPVVKTQGDLIGIVTHYFPHVQAAVVKLKKPLAMGQTVKVKGHTSDFTQTVTSIQIDRVDISSAKKGDEIGLQVISQVRQGDKVYKL